MDVEMEKRKFLNLCGKRDRALLSGKKRMTLGDMERLTYLTEFFELENYGIALWKEFGDDVKEPFEAMMKMLDEPECIEDRWLDDEAKGEKWLLEFQELALTEEYREWIRNYIKGDSILCEKRFHPDTHYMVEIEMLKTDNTLGKKGAYIRKFLTEDEYSSMLQKQEKHLIKIKRQAIVQKGNLRYIPPPDRLDRRRERDIL